MVMIHFVSELERFLGHVLVIHMLVFRWITPPVFRGVAGVGDPRNSAAAAAGIRVDAYRAVRGGDEAVGREERQHET